MKKTKLEIKLIFNVYILSHFITMFKYSSLHINKDIKQAGLRPACFMSHDGDIISLKCK